MSDFQPVSIHLLRVSGRKIGQVNKSIVFSYPTTERSMIGTHLYDLAISFNDSSVVGKLVCMQFQVWTSVTNQGEWFSIHIKMKQGTIKHSVLSF